MEEERSFLDRVVEALAGALDALGLNGTRLRWRWNQRRRDLGEAGLKTEVMWRSATAPHKMCRSCRALVPRSARVCTSCGEPLATVRAPGIGRLMANVLPGATATTSLLLLVNGVLFALILMTQLKQGGGVGLLSTFDGRTLVRFGSGLSPATVGLGEWWRLVTPIFLHGGLLHFAFNSYALIQLGPLVEEEYGTERFAVLYVLSGIGGNVFSQCLRDTNTVGASGAICGLMGLLLACGMRRGGAIGGSIRASMMQSAIYMLIFSFLPGIDLLCHIGGLVTGFALGWIVPSGPIRGRAAATGWDLLLFAVLALILWCFWQMGQHGAGTLQRLGW